MSLTLFVNCGDTPDVTSPSYSSGLGENGSETIIKGDIKELVIHKDNQTQFGIRILEDGTLIITDYGSMCWKQYVTQNIRFMPDHPWLDNKK